MNSIATTISRITLVKFLFLFFYFSFFVRYYVEIYLIIPIILLSISALMNTIYIILKRDLYSNIMWILLAIDFIALIGILYNQNKSIAEIGLLLSWQSFGVLISREKKFIQFLYKINNLLFWFTIFSIFFAYVNNQLIYFFLTSLSGINTLSILLIGYLSIETIFLIRLKSKITYLKYLIAFLVSILLGGSGGIISTGILLFGVFLFNENNKLKIGIKILFSSVALLSLIFSYQDISSTLFERLTNDNSRIAYWAFYFNLLKNNPLGLFFGVNASTNYVLNFEKNLHNTFLNWHYYYGLFPMIIFLYLILYSLIRNLRFRPLILVIILTTFIRAFTDEATFGFMVLWIYLFISEVTNKRSSNPKKFFLNHSIENNYLI